MTVEHWGRTAGAVVNIYSTGQPGRVALEVLSLGPEHLNQDEMVRILRAAADQVELGVPEGESGS